MCGFAGVIAWDERYRRSRETLAKMSAAVAHRGPDGEGFHVNHDGPITPDHPQVSLAFRRLAILDPDERSMQPFTDGRHWLVFNGEIYNFRELKKELSALRPDYAWRTTGDTEVLLLSYAVWGETCVEHLNGMFAFAVWDEVEKSLFLARDRMGQKPLYVAASDWPRFSALAFASEIGALRSLAWFPNEASEYNITEFLRYGYSPTEQTAFEYCLQLGRYWNTFRWNVSADAAMSSEGLPYFDANERPGLNTNPVTTTRDLVRQSVRRQLVSDVPLGVFLSGGIDSSVIAASARREGPVQTFSISFDDPRYDESEFAEAVARHLGTCHRTFRVTPDAVKDLPRLAAVFGTPFGDSSALPTHYLARETRKHVTVALSGDGGDELFGGYDRYRAMRLGRKLVPWAVGPVLRWGRWAQWGPPKSRLTRAGRLIASLGFPEAERYEGYLRVFDEPLLKAIWPTTPQYVHPRSIAKRYEGLRTYLDSVQAALAVDRVTYLPDDLLTKVDRCSMMHGLEVRSPFMDHELVQFAAGLTTDQLLKGGPKRMLREAFKDDLPAWVFKRKKMGFAVPIGDWFRGPLRGMLRDTLFSAHAFGRTHFDMKVVERLVEEHESFRVDHSQRLYALLMLELWWDIARAGVGG
jgi:asparagine synthase (glutamine-hydrolysing)